MKNKTSLLWKFCVVWLLLPTLSAAAERDMYHYSGLPIPRFASLNQDETNLRVGPGKGYPIRWVYHRKDLPVEIIGEYGHWRNIRDHEGTEGWVNKSLLGGKRTAFLRGETRPMRLAPDANSAVVVNVGALVPGTLKNCTKQWCHMIVGKYEGWLPREHLWGIYDDEEINAK